MDFIHGTKITVVGGVERTEFDGRALADALFRAYLQQILIDGVFHADPHPGNVFLTEDPGFAMLLFIAAAGGGFWMAWTILAGDVRTRHH